MFGAVCIITLRCLLCRFDAVKATVFLNLKLKLAFQQCYECCWKAIKMRYPNISIMKLYQFSAAFFWPNGQLWHEIETVPFIVIITMLCLHIISVFASETANRLTGSSCAINENEDQRTTLSLSLSLFLFHTSPLFVFHLCDPQNVTTSSLSQYYF